MSNYNAKYAVVQHALNPQARFLPACPLCAYWCSAGLIHHKTSAWHRHALAIRISFRIPAPGPPPLGPGRLLRVRQSAAATAKDHCCSLPPPRRPQALEQPSGSPSEKWSPPGDARQEETCSIPPWAHAPCFRWLSRWLCWWASCSWRPSSRSRVPGGQGWKVVECFPPCCRLQHNANTVSFRRKQDARHYWGSTRNSILQKNLLLKEILSDGTEDLIEMHDC